MDFSQCVQMANYITYGANWQTHTYIYKQEVQNFPLLPYGIVYCFCTEAVVLVTGDGWSIFTCKLRGVAVSRILLFSGFTSFLVVL